MILKLVDGKVLINTMFVPELRGHTFLQYELEVNTAHLHPVLYINEQSFKGNRIFIDVKELLNTHEVLVKVELLDDQDKIIHVYQSKVAYNIYQVLGNKPIRPDIEDYLYKLEEKIRLLKQELIEEQVRLNAIIKEIEEKGEII